MTRLNSILYSNRRLIGHVVFWLGVLVFYTFYFGQRQDSYGQSLFFVGLLMPITIATTYFLLYWLIPRYLLEQRYILFGVYFIYTLIMSLYLELVLVLGLYINVAEYQAMFVRPGLVDLLSVIVGMYLVVFLAAALHLLKRWYSMQQENARLERIRMETELKLKDAELQLLKSQIHPHFLFNTLNNLYALSLEQSEHVPDVVLRISSILDYMLYRSNAKYVPLQAEVEHLQNYLALEKLRYDARSDISFDIQGDINGQAIAPLLLIPFVENGIKHGISKSPGSLGVTMHVSNHSMEFSVENTRPAEQQPASSDHEGIGLRNVQRRLDLLYPDAHELHLRDEEERFAIHLTLQLDERKHDEMPDRG